MLTPSRSTAAWRDLARDGRRPAPANAAAVMRAQGGNWWVQGLPGREGLGDQGEPAPCGDQAGEALRRCTHPEHQLPRVRDQPTGQREEREAEPLRAGGNARDFSALRTL